MSSDVLESWVEGLFQQCTRWNIVFVQLGEAYPIARDAIAPSVDSIVSAVDYLDNTELEGKLRLVTELESLAEPGAPSLGRLRERVIADRDNGTRVILLSRRPKIAFPTAPGSQVLWDAKLVSPPLYSTPESWNFGEEATREGVPAEIVIERALRELGEIACAGLDAVLFEDGRASEELTSLAEPLLDALLGAGMITHSGDKLCWAISDGRLSVRSALSEVIAGMNRPQDDFARVASDCWIVERTVKQALRARAKALWGEKWRAELLGVNLSSAALGRACGGTYASAETLEDIRDPLEWLTLTETLGLLDHAQVGTLGVSPSMWTLMSSELLPVKDRIERSQLMRRSDVDIASRWVDLLAQRLTASGSPSPSESIASATTTQHDLLVNLRTDLALNPQFRRDIEKDLMSLALATVRFVAHTLDTVPPYVAAFSDRADAPLERAVQDSFKLFLDSSDLAGRSAVEVSSVGGGRADVVLYFNDGSRYVTEVKRELARASRDELEASYLPQTVAYQSANVPFGQLLVLDLTEGREVRSERLDESIWVAHSRNDDGVVITSTIIAVVRGNRPSPSRRKS
ncbi:hypothetical protein [Cryobacterium sp. TMT2-4]|uniref:hypothetical protein n=1 Tax=Cryobacterium sp. TMT2-4 TaxID=1259254 RepID=UPI00106AC3E9|nr:hypothetical protein [Cryobacterium sp. TMT2-4]TFC63856.1 hypothetical protein E3O54_16105 [Cryobacterium sp. TMT2-4]